MKRLLHLLRLWHRSFRTPPSLSGPLQRVRLAQYELQYYVPATWVCARHATDSCLIITYSSADRTLKFSAGKVWGVAGVTTAEQALAHMASQYDIDLRHQHPVATRYQHLQFLEVSGTTPPTAGPPRCYRALATHHRGHVLLIYVAGSSDTFPAHHAAVESVLHSMAPYYPR